MIAALARRATPALLAKLDDNPPSYVSHNEHHEVGLTASLRSGRLGSQSV